MERGAYQSLEYNTVYNDARKSITIHIRHIMINKQFFLNHLHIWLKKYFEYWLLLNIKVVECLMVIDEDFTLITIPISDLFLHCDSSIFDTYGDLSEYNRNTQTKNYGRNMANFIHEEVNSCSFFNLIMIQIKVWFHWWILIDNNH